MRAFSLTPPETRTLHPNEVHYRLEVVKCQGKSRSQTDREVAGAETASEGADPELVLCGRYVVSTRLSDEGFVFRYAALEEALREVLRR